VRDAPQWWLHAALCLRLAQSRSHLRDRSGALTAWFQLCWHAPSEAAEALDRRHPDIGMAASWRRFVDSADEGTVDTPGGDGAAVAGAGADATLGAGDFPAWLLRKSLQATNRALFACLKRAV
jgi:hypothetical protein